MCFSFSESRSWGATSLVVVVSLGEILKIGGEKNREETLLRIEERSLLLLLLLKVRLMRERFFEQRVVVSTFKPSCWVLGRTLDE